MNEWMHRCVLMSEGTCNVSIYIFLAYMYINSIFFLVINNNKPHLSHVAQTNECGQASGQDSNPRSMLVSSIQQAKSIKGCSLLNNVQVQKYAYISDRENDQRHTERPETDRMTRDMTCCIKLHNIVVEIVWSSNNYTTTN